MALDGSDYIALAAVAVSIASLVFSWKASQKVDASARENTDIQHAVIENSLRQSIEGASARINDIAGLILPFESKKQLNTISKEDELTLQGYHRSLDAAIESWLNTYENACSNYIDGKIDKIRFRRNYDVEIRNLLDRPDLKKYFDSNTSRYKPILKVYRKWNDLENC
jgi:hypothetical protein